MPQNPRMYLQIMGNQLRTTLNLGLVVNHTRVSRMVYCMRFSIYSFIKRLCVFGFKHIVLCFSNERSCASWGLGYRI